MLQHPTTESPESRDEKCSIPSGVDDDHQYVEPNTASIPQQQQPHVFSGKRSRDLKLFSISEQRSVHFDSIRQSEPLRESLITQEDTDQRVPSSLDTTSAAVQESNDGLLLGALSPLEEGRVVSSTDTSRDNSHGSPNDKEEGNNLRRRRKISLASDQTDSLSPPKRQTNTDNDQLSDHSSQTDQLSDSSSRRESGSTGNVQSLRTPKRDETSIAQAETGDSRSRRVSHSNGQTQSLVPPRQGEHPTTTSSKNPKLRQGSVAGGALQSMHTPKRDEMAIAIADSLADSEGMSDDSLRRISQSLGQVDSLLPPRQDSKEPPKATKSNRKRHASISSRRRSSGSAPTPSKSMQPPKRETESTSTATSDLEPKRNHKSRQESVAVGQLQSMHTPRRDEMAIAIAESVEETDGASISSRRRISDSVPTQTKSMQPPKRDTEATSKTEETKRNHKSRQVSVAVGQLQSMHTPRRDEMAIAIAESVEETDGASISSRRRISESVPTQTKSMQPPKRETELPSTATSDQETKRNHKSRQVSVAVGQVQSMQTPRRDEMAIAIAESVEETNGASISSRRRISESVPTQTKSMQPPKRETESPSTATSDQETKRNHKSRQESVAVGQLQSMQTPRRDEMAIAIAESQQDDIDGVISRRSETVSLDDEVQSMPPPKRDTTSPPSEDHPTKKGRRRNESVGPGQLQSMQTPSRDEVKDDSPPSARSMRPSRESVSTEQPQSLMPPSRDNVLSNIDEECSTSSSTTSNESSRKSISPPPPQEVSSNSEDRGSKTRATPIAGGVDATEYYEEANEQYRHPWGSGPWLALCGFVNTMSADGAANSRTTDENSTPPRKQNYPWGSGPWLKLCGMMSTETNDHNDQQKRWQK